MPWSSLCTLLELIWRPQEVWKPVETDLPLCGWVAVIPIRAHFVIIPYNIRQLMVKYLGGRTFHDWACWTYHSTMLEFTELLTVTHCFTNAYRDSLHAWVLAFMHLWLWKWMENLISIIWMCEWIFLAAQVWADFLTLSSYGSVIGA